MFSKSLSIHGRIVTLPGGRPPTRPTARGIGPGTGIRNGTAMLTNRPRRPLRFAALILLAVIVFGLGLSFSASVARADLPKLWSNGDATKTVAWWMNTTEGLTLQGVDLANGNATLPWQPQRITWDSPAEFTANGSLDANLSMSGNAISLRSDSSNHLTDGDFVTAGSWRYVPSAPGNVTANWNATSQSAVLRHISPSTEALWDGLDSTSGWALTGSPGAVVNIWENTTGQKEGLGMLGLDLALPSTAGSFAGAQHPAPVNWSGFDRMVIWILPLNVTSPSVPGVRRVRQSQSGQIGPAPGTGAGQPAAAFCTEPGLLGTLASTMRASHPLPPRPSRSIDRGRVRRQ